MANAHGDPEEIRNIELSRERQASTRFKIPSLNRDHLPPWSDCDSGCPASLSSMAPPPIMKAEYNPEKEGVNRTGPGSLCSDHNSEKSLSISYHPFDVNPMKHQEGAKRTRAGDSYSEASDRSFKSSNHPFNENFNEQQEWPRNTTSYQTGQSQTGSPTNSISDPTGVQQEGLQNMLCDICSEDKAVKICLTCNTSYCETHVKTHLTLPKFQKHTLAELNDPRVEQRLNSGDGLPPPSDIKFQPVTSDSLVVNWDPPDGLIGQQKFWVSWRCHGQQKHMRVKNVCELKITGLKLGRKYDFAVGTVSDDGNVSNWNTANFFTAVPMPEDVIAEHVESTSLTLRWNKADRMDQIPQHFAISYGGAGTDEKIIHTEDCFTNLSGLQPGTEYRISVCTVLSEGEESESVTLFVCTRSCLLGLLSTTGLEEYYENKLALGRALEVNSCTISDEPILNMHSIPRAFFKKLMIADVDARSVKCDMCQQDELCNEIDSHDTTVIENERRNYIHPLDLITAMFLCSDGFLQQEMVLKMAMCQFAVPLLLPNCETKQITMILWAMREIVKKFAPVTETASSVEERIVCQDIPLVSFVRQGKSSLSKSQTLNKMLSNPQQYHDTFVHRDMDCGDAPRSISEGLVEISWYLPCGNRNTDIFNRPLVVANLRGDIETFDKQFNFLSQTSTAVYIFSDEISAMQGKNIKGELYLVTGSSSSERGHRASFKYPRNCIVKRHNDADFVKTLQSSVGKIIENNRSSKKMEHMTDIARLCGIVIDEDKEDCQEARKAAFGITSNISDTVKFKEEHLPFQKAICKDVFFEDTQMGNEERRRRRKHFQTTDVIKQFIHTLSISDARRTYFLKWMRMDLDNLSRQNLSKLREHYKELKTTNSPKEFFADLNDNISDCSLGLEHFLREVGQIYEAACSLPENHPEMKQIEHLPRLCAQLMLDGFPIELVDGDASNIPMKWISAVLTELHALVQSKSKIRVITVLGVQGTGKSTLLNTMFGVQFAVSSGRCTRGAFMLLLKVNKELKEQLKCDFIMVIDTEGLKAPELELQDSSPERDNELATLVVGLSDITIVNMTMENSTEMTDILQVVIHTFLGMKGSLKKPICHFVHQNALHLSADANVRDREKLLEKLNEKTLAAAKMEKKESVTKFTDVMEYDEKNNWYVPGLWHGIPPMAPVNAGYSVAVYDFKKRLMQDFKKLQKGDTLVDFLRLTNSLWESVNSFSFRNSLCTVFNSWESEFNTKITTWTERALNRISAVGRPDQSTIKDIRNVEKDLLKECNEILELETNGILDNVENFFKKQESIPRSFGKFRAEFVLRAETLKRDTASKVKQSLSGAVTIKQETSELDNVKSMEAKIIENKVLDLVRVCQQKKPALAENALKQEFESMWKKALSEIDFKELLEIDVSLDASIILDKNLSGSVGNVARDTLTDLTSGKCGSKHFVVETRNWKKRAGSFMKHGDQDYHKKKLQSLCNNIITECEDFITQRVEREEDYQSGDIRELLQIIDTSLQRHKGLGVSEECEVSLKHHVCGIAVREFKTMHDEYITTNNRRRCLERSQGNYYEDFMDLFHKRDQCLKKAKEFTNVCLQPAALQYVGKMIGHDVLDLFLQSKDYSTKGAPHFYLLKELLDELDYDKYMQYMHNYEKYVKNWLLNQLVRELSKADRLQTLKKKHISEIVKFANTTISNVKQSKPTGTELKHFIQVLCYKLAEKLKFPKNSLDSGMILNSEYKDQFADHLAKCVKEMEKLLSREFDEGSDIEEVLKRLPLKLEDEIFARLFGCGKQCPDCKVPCDAAEKEHRTHFSRFHRPQGLSGLRNRATKTLLTNICSSGQSEKYNSDWIINQISSSTDYWKYVFVSFNGKIAKDSGSLPAKIPEDWRAITHKDALLSLKHTFNMR